MLVDKCLAALTSSEHNDYPNKSIVKLVDMVKTFTLLQAEVHRL
jgi:hypothetical protein